MLYTIKANPDIEGNNIKVNIKTYNIKYEVDNENHILYEYIFLESNKELTQNEWLDGIKKLYPKKFKNSRKSILAAILHKDAMPEKHSTSVVLFNDETHKFDGQVAKSDTARLTYATLLLDSLEHEDTMDD